MTMLAGFHCVYEPPKGRERTLLLLHGTGGDEHDLLPLGRAIAPGAGLLAARGRVLERGMPRFFRRVAEGVFDEQDVVRRASELSEFVHEAAAAFGFDPGLLSAAGFSNGANIAAALLLLHPGVLDSAVLMRAMVPVAEPPMHAIDGTPVLILEGRNDSIVPSSEGRRLTAMLEERGAVVDLQWLDAGHGLVEQDVALGRAFLDQ